MDIFSKLDTYNMNEYRNIQKNNMGTKDVKIIG